MAFGTLAVLAGVALLAFANSAIISYFSLSDQKTIAEVLKKVEAGEPISENDVAKAEDAYAKWKANGKAADISLDEGDEAMLEVMERIREYDNIA